jgi:hypothetical protein
MSLYSYSSSPFLFDGCTAISIWSLFGFRSRCRRWEVDIEDGLFGTYSDTLPTQTALLEVDVGKIVLNGNSTEVTFLLTLATTDTADIASLHGHRTFVLVDT